MKNVDQDYRILCSVHKLNEIAQRWLKVKLLDMSLYVCVDVCDKALCVKPKSYLIDRAFQKTWSL